MRKTVLVSLAVFSVSVFGLSSLAQRRGRGRGRGAPVAVAAAPTEPPMTEHIQEELGGIQWGWNHEQVVDYFRRQIVARYQPQLRNQGQVEQDRLITRRDAEVEELRRTYLQFNGAPPQRRWDTSFVRDEYSHNNGESMLLYQNPENGNREFFFFFSDRLWKRYQARTVPQGMTFDTFVGALEGLFGPGLHVADPPGSDHVTMIRWQDVSTGLRVIDNSTFYNSYCLVYEERATLSRLTELRRNAPPAKTVASGAANRVIDQPQVGNVENDPNADIIDRITGKIRNTQQAAPARPTPAGPGQGAPAARGRDAGSAAPNANEDDTRMFRGI